MIHRILLVSAIVTLAVANAYAEAIEIPSTPENSPAAPVLAENTVNTGNAVDRLEQQITKTTPVVNTAPSKSPHHNAMHATLRLKQEGQRLYAYVVVEQPQNRSGHIRIDWTPPLHSSCDKSSYILSYEGKKFHTQAYRTLGYSLINGKSISCTGTWQANVKNAQGVTLGTAKIHIESTDSYANAKMRSLAAIA